MLCSYKREEGCVSSDLTEDVLYIQSICFNKVVDDGRCVHHPIEGPPAPPFNDVCPICLEDDDGASLMRCRHQIHVLCISGATKLECPICADDLFYLPDLVKAKIEDNADRYKQEQLEQERQDLLEFQQSLNAEDDNYTPEMEVVSAMSYMMSIGIPLASIGNMNIHIDENTTRLPRGMVFRRTVNEVLESIQRELNTEPMELDSSDSDNGTYTESDDKTLDEEGNFRAFIRAENNTSNISHLLSNLLHSTHDFDDDMI